MKDRRVEFAAQLGTCSAISRLACDQCREETIHAYGICVWCKTRRKEGTRAMTRGNPRMWTVKSAPPKHYRQRRARRC